MWAKEIEGKMTATVTHTGGHQTGVASTARRRKRVGPRAFLAALFSLCAALLLPLGLPGAEARQSEGADATGFVQIALPASGEMLVENRRGGVQVEVWSEDHVALAASVQGQNRGVQRQSAQAQRRGAQRQKQDARGRLPVNVEEAGGSLSIKVERATAADSSRVDLKLRVPSSARLRVFTSDGELSVSGLPASLVAQTISGDLSLAIPSPPDASVTAQSLNGSVALGEGLELQGSSERVLHGKVQTRWGAASRSVNLFSGRGRISLKTLAGEAADARAARSDVEPVRREVETARSNTRSGRGDAGPSRSESRRARVGEPQDDATPKTVAPKPQPKETPQEVDEDDVVRVDSDLVTLNVSVVERASGRGLTGLSAGDFRVYEDNVEQHVEHFESAEAPFDLLLLLDLSGSTARVTDTIRAAARRFVAATRTQDRVGIITFAGETNVVSPLTADRAALDSSINRIAPPKGDTRLYDALAYAIEYMTRVADPARRRAIILMSDGLDSTLPNVTGTGSTLSYEEVRNRAQEFDGILYTVWTSTEYEAFSPEDIQPETFDLAHDRMKELSDAGGGAFYEVEKLEDLADAYERVVADLGTVYSLSYRPTNKERDGRWRAIRIRLPRLPDAVARARRGYFAR